MEANNLDEVLQHYGVKGMKWGQVKSSVSKGVKSHYKKKNAKIKELDKKFHEKKKGNKRYDKMYKANLKKSKGNHDKAVAITRNAYVKRNQAVAIYTAVKAGPAAIAVGKVSYNLAKKAVTSPESIRAGKNVLQAIKRSPVRYVDGKTMSNVLNDINNASTRRIGQW